MMKNPKNEGITLIALITTIIVLIILAGVTITALTDGGIIESTQEARNSTDLDRLKEEAQTASAKYNAQMKKENNFASYLSGIKDATIEKLSIDTYYIERGNAKITVSEDGEVTEGKVDVWDGTSSVAPTIDETKKEVHIYTTKELKGFADLTNSGNVLDGYKIYLENNLDFGARKENGEWETSNNESRRWIPISKENTNILKADFYGKNHYIKGIYVKESTNYAGVLGCTAAVYDLTVKNSYIYGTRMVGGVVACNKGGNVENCHNENTTVIGYTEGVSTTTQGVAGVVAVVGAKYSVKNCTNSGYVKGNCERIGGVAGHGNKNIRIENCINYGTIDGGMAGTFIGGVVGHINSGSEVFGCTNYGTVIDGANRVGGVLGNASNTTTIENCCNHGQVEGKISVGGIIGMLFSTVKSCSNFGNVIGNDQNAGGIVGETGAGNDTTAYTITIQNCYNRANVSGVNSVGGIVGWISATNTQGTVQNNYNTGTILASDEPGGVIGHINTNAFTVTNNYTLQGSAHITKTAIEKTAEEMQTDTFAQLLGANNWTRVEGKNDGYPMLKWEV